MLPVIGSSDSHLDSTIMYPNLKDMALVSIQAFYYNLPFAVGAGRSDRRNRFNLSNT